MSVGIVAAVSVRVCASPETVWEALTSPELIRLYMFGSEVRTSWKKGSEITWNGSWHGNAYQDRGVVLEFVPNALLRLTHFSPMSGLEDSPENYHTLSFSLSFDGRATELELSQDNNKTVEEKEHSEKNWGVMLEGLKKVAEGGA
jgi:uncharacterized protein YndB with AHSA1/START domain